MSHFNSNFSDDATQTAATKSKLVTSAIIEDANAYEAPAIENIFSPADLQREVLYAFPGDVDPGGGGGGGGGIPSTNTE